MKLAVVALGAAALLSAGAASAGPMDTQLILKGGVANVEAGPGDYDGDGQYMAASVKITLPRQLYFTAGYETSSTEDGDASSDLDELRLGVGYQQPLAYDMWVGADLDYANLRAASGGEHDTGSGVAANIRFAAELASNADFSARLGYVDYNGADVELSGPDMQAGLGVKLTGNLRLLFEYRLQRLSDGPINVDLDVMSLGLRFDL